MIKQVARKVVFPLMHNLGISKLASAFTKNRSMILLYHGVTKKNSNFFSPRHIDAIQFEKHIHYLAKEFQIVSLAELIKSQKSSSKKKRIAITFDDGYRNNFTEALSILEKYKAPATFFISGKCMLQDKPEPLFPDVITLLEFLKPDLNLHIETLGEINLNQMRAGELYSVVKLFDKSQRQALENQIKEKVDLVDFFQNWTKKYGECYQKKS